MSTVRLRRLKADSAKLQEYVRRHPRVRLVQMEGDPPERYQLEYRINSLRMVNGELQPVHSHLVEVVLPRNYPRTPPQCRMLSPVFHPNIAPHAICVGDHWGAGESLESIIIRIGEMLAYQSYNVKSPLNGEAARWVEENKHRVPLDRVSMLPEEENGNASKLAAPIAPPSIGPRVVVNSGPQSSVVQPQTAAVAPTPPPVSSPTPGNASLIQVDCPLCATSYRVAPNVVGKNVRCKKCGHLFVCIATQTS
jgi:predicted Zn finger-like uncharacterized protein